MSLAVLSLATVWRSRTALINGLSKLWTQRLRNAGYSVQPQNVDNMNSVKQRVGISAAMGSCHTAEVGGYFVEGQVPVEDIKRLLRDRPDAKGLTVPGMPVGSREWKLLLARSDPTRCCWSVATAA